MTTSRDLHKMASIIRMVEVVASGNPKKMARYAKNKILGKALWKLTNPLFRK